MPLRVLGIDPGLTRCGYGVIDAGRAPELVRVGVVRTPSDMEHGQRLVTILAGLREVIADTEPDVMALERVFANNQRNTVMGVAQVSGLVIHEAASSGTPLELFTPSEVKNAVTGYGGAEKAQVGEMVRRILRLQAVPKPADAADALALAIAASWRSARAIPTDASRRTPRAAAGALTPAQRAWLDAEKSVRKQF
ncbi:crossover junction endodeoxyribonuclease RuvC [Gryllotalpicola ginsengisoli]|uniref:crossover junction endodeoxyribonuclease RuvC n=1 Tax=Gryllotalpicola ginsengisoli TaxID=444608 RepID=UPI0003B7934B|nr:crossover junction endodeoxyribonuclease RuvC [Gryllotalpicola ginsengisoli]